MLALNLLNLIQKSFAKQKQATLKNYKFLIRIQKIQNGEFSNRILLKIKTVSFLILNGTALYNSKEKQLLT